MLMDFLGGGAKYEEKKCVKKYKKSLFSKIMGGWGKCPPC